LLSVLLAWLPLKKEGGVGRHAHRFYPGGEKSNKALDLAKDKLHELFGDSMPRRTVNY
jgi:hypothetical protein